MDLKILENVSNEKFKLCNNDEDRVQLILNYLDESRHLQSKCPYGKKTPRESEKFRNYGNLLLNSSSPNLEEVLKLYSKSILYAPPGSEQLSLAYANRSAVLFRGKYYDECLEDISRALETGYPDNLKPKLLIRRVTCNYALTGNVDFETDEGLIEARALIEKLPATNKMRKMVEDTLTNPAKITSIEKQMKKTYPKYQPEIKTRNSHLPGASDAIALRYSEECGRHLVATRDINSGEVLLIERPYATLVDDEWIYCICSYCAKRTWNGIPCDYCIHAMYCSTECKLAAWEGYHDIECEIFGFAKNIGIWNNGLLGVRITIMAIKEAGSVEALRMRLKELDSVKASDVEIPIDPNSYETFYIMSENPEHRQLKSLMICSSVASSLTYSLAVMTNLFSERIIGGLQEVKDSEQFLFVAGLMSKNMRIAQNRLYGWKPEEKIAIEDSEILTMLPVASFFNNRCYDAAERLRFDEDIILVTYTPISKGDQVFTNYCDDYKILSRDVRRAVLNDGWQFVCNCLACEEDWSLYTSTSWTDQDLPPRIVKALHDEMRKFEYLSLEEISDPLKMIPLRAKFCRLLNFIYPLVKKACINVDLLVYVIEHIHMKLSSTVHSRFMDKLNGNDLERYNLEIFINSFNSWIPSM